MLDPPISEECELRPLEESDAAELYAVVDANRAYLARWLPWAQGQTPENTVEFLRVARKQRADGEAVQSAILREGRIVGVIGNHAIDPAHRSTELGYWLAEDAQGGGTMTAAVRAYTDHAFSAWNLNRVQIRVGVENTPSRRLAERLGFREEGVLREAERIGDRYLDLVVYSMLAADWAVPGQLE